MFGIVYYSTFSDTNKTQVLIKHDQNSQVLKLKIDTYKNRHSKNPEIQTCVKEQKLYARNSLVSFPPGNFAKVLH